MNGIPSSVKRNSRHREQPGASHQPRIWRPLFKQIVPPLITCAGASNYDRDFFFLLRLNFDHKFHCTLGKSEIIHTDLISDLVFLLWKSKFVSSRHNTNGVEENVQHLWKRPVIINLILSLLALFMSYENTGIGRWLSLTILHAADTAILKLSHFSLPNKTPTMLE